MNLLISGSVGPLEFFRSNLGISSILAYDRVDLARESMGYDSVGLGL